MSKLIVRGRRVVLPEGVSAAAIHIEDGRIVRAGPLDEPQPCPGRGDEHSGTDPRTDHRVDSGPARPEILDAGDLVVSPGLVDTHVHINEPGRTDWEGFDSATRAAAAGGVTTIVDMPLNGIPATTTVDALEIKRLAAHGQCHVDVGFWGGVVPGNEAALDGLVAAGVRGFKCFLAPSGVDEFRHVDEGDLQRALPAIARSRVPLLVHAECPSMLRSAAPPLSSYAAYVATRPPAAEVEAVRLMICLAAESGVHVHIVHVAAAEAVDHIARARAAGVPMTAETCPHYLTFAAGDISDGATVFKCAPPIRHASHRDGLWEALRGGVLDLVASDHSPSPPALKCAGDFSRAWGGIASLELSLAAVWTGARQRRFGPADLASWMSAAPARLAGLAGRKGAIAPGLDADLVIWDPDAEFTVAAAGLQQRHKITPYVGCRLRGVVRTTFLRGRRVWDEGRLLQAGSGQLI